MALWIPTLVLAALIAAGVWWCLWQLRANDRAAQERNAALLRGLSALGAPVALAPATAANDGENEREDRSSGAYPSARPGLPEETIRALARQLRDPAEPPRSPECYAALVGLEVVEAPWLPEACPSMVEGDSLLLRPTPYPARGILIEVVNVLCERAGVPATPDDLVRIGSMLAEPPPRSVATK